MDTATPVNDAPAAISRIVVENATALLEMAQAITKTIDHLQDFAHDLLAGTCRPEDVARYIKEVIERPYFSRNTTEEVRDKLRAIAATMATPESLTAFAFNKLKDDLRSASLRDSRASVDAFQAIEVLIRCFLIIGEGKHSDKLLELMSDQLGLIGYSDLNHYLYSHHGDEWKLEVDILEAPAVFRQLCTGWTREGSE